MELQRLRSADKSKSGYSVFVRPQNLVGCLTKFEFQGTGDCNGERIQLQKLRRTAAVSQHQEGLPSKPSGAGSVGRGGTAEWISFCPRGKRRIWSLCRRDARTGLLGVAHRQ